MSNISIYNYLLAFNILKGFKRINTIENINDENYETLKDEIILESKNISAENALLKIEAFNNLSSEAKDLIHLIINAPDDFINLFKTPQRMIISRNTFKECISDVWKSPLLADQILGEIKEWVKTYLQ